MNYQSKIILSFIAVLILSGCATFKPQYKSDTNQSSSPTAEIEHSFYLIGDAGNSESSKLNSALEVFKMELKNASKNSTAIFLGDNIYEKGLPNKSDKNYEQAKNQIKVQTKAVKDFKGKSIFIPGNHDWYSGVKGLKNQEKYIEDKLGKNTFLPDNGCPVEKVHVTEDIELILVDSHWFVTNWDKHPTINDNCQIKTRAAFLDEYSSLIKKARGKTTIVAIHHPMFTNGSHGGEYSFKSHMSPLPFLGTIKNMIRKTSGLANVDLQNARYNQLKRQLVALSQENDKVVFVSGHEHNLQFLTEDNLTQIVSGSGSKVSAVRNIGSGQFGYATPGYARLDVFKDGSSSVKFYSSEDKKTVFESEVYPSNDNKNYNTYPENFPKEVSASIYTEAETNKSATSKFLWGERYRKYFSTKVKAPTVRLDTLYGGLLPVRKGGGNQSKSLRLEDKDGTQYVMRALRKEAEQYLQALIFKDQYIEGQFKDTATEDLLLDVFAGSHPYAPFVIGDLSSAVGIYHTNPKLFYVPKQNTLGHYNTEFGDELYMIEEHTSEGHSDLASFGYQNELLSTDDMMDELHEDGDNIVDEAAYIRARLFDMLIGDWDRHQDQWRWIEFKENGRKVYRPMPRDRDQAFSKMADGFLLGLAVKIIPAAKLLRVYSDDLVDVKSVNVEPYPLDMELIQQSDRKVWDAQVKAIQEGITDAVIEQAFLNMPVEVRDTSVEDIKSKLKARRTNLGLISDRYYNLVNKFAVIKGTDKDDWYDIERLPNGQTKVSAYRIKNGKKADKFHERIYSCDDTKEIWIYALDDDDVFHVFGKGDREIKMRLIGGQNNDTYDIQEGKRVTFYDYKSKKNTVITNKGHKKFTDDYETNVYDYTKLKNNTNQIIPIVGANPDDGLKIGVLNTTIFYGFERNPFTARHTIGASYYFATNGFDLNYSGEFANIFQGVNFEIDINLNSPNYAVNFFGFGNESINPNAEDDDQFDLDYNRVKIRTFKAIPSLVWRNNQETSIFKLGVIYESNNVDRTNGRFIDQTNEIPNTVFEKQNFYGIDAGYHFENKDDTAFPTLGMQFGMRGGYKSNIDTRKGFGYLMPELGFDYKLIPSGQLVLATIFRAQINIGDDFEFYQGATLGANNGLRGYRNERFTGKRSFVQSTDIRWSFTDLKTGVLPISLGLYGGVDYGRIWINNDNSQRWNNSFGGGLFVNMAKLLTANISVFNSNDGLRLAFRIGFGF